MPEKARMVVFCVMFIFMLAPLHVLAQGPPCSYTDETSGVKYDFTKLSTSDFSTTAGGYTYNLRVCGTSEQKCPNDPDQITTGMAVRLKILVALVGTAYSANNTVQSPAQTGQHSMAAKASA